MLPPVLPRRVGYFQHVGGFLRCISVEKILKTTTNFQMVRAKRPIFRYLCRVSQFSIGGMFVAFSSGFPTGEPTGDSQPFDFTP